jgi:hypothetical protein
LPKNTALIGKIWHFNFEYFIKLKDYKNHLIKFFILELLEQHNMLGEEDDTTAECESDWQGTDSFLLRNDIEEFFDQVD